MEYANSAPEDAKGALRPQGPRAWQRRTPDRRAHLPTGEK